MSYDLYDLFEEEILPPLEKLIADKSTTDISDLSDRFFNILQFHNDSEKLKRRLLEIAVDADETLPVESFVRECVALEYPECVLLKLKYLSEDAIIIKADYQEGKDVE